MWCENFNINNFDFSYCECSNNEHKRERVPRWWGWPRVSSEKFLMMIIRVFWNIYLETHNSIESIEGVRAPWGLLCKKINNKNRDFCIMHVEIQNSRKQLWVRRRNHGFVVRKTQSQKLGFFELYILKCRTQERE